MFISKQETPMFKVTRMFLTGNLKGLTFTESTSVAMEVGKVYKPSGNNPATKLFPVRQCNKL